MAFEASHIRFALDLKDKCRPINTKQYITGALYPDSRFKTGIKRDLTHPKNFMSWDIVQANDFKKGWFTHLLCDKVQASSIRKRFPYFFTDKELETGDDSWIALTAVKVLQDLDDAKNFDIAQHLPDLNCIEVHNNEDRALLEEFYRIILKTYQNPQALTLDTYGVILEELGLPLEVARNVVEKAQELQNDNQILNLIYSIYAEVLINVREENIYK